MGAWSLSYIFLANNGLLSNCRDELRQTHHLCSRMPYGRSRSYKVVDFGSNRRAIQDFLLFINRPYRASFLRYGDLLVENGKFSYPSLVYRQLEFLEKFYGSWLQSPSRIWQWGFRDTNSRRFDRAAGCIRQTDGRLCQSYVWYWQRNDNLLCKICSKFV